MEGHFVELDDGQGASVQEEVKHLYEVHFVFPLFTYLWC